MADPKKIAAVAEAIQATDPKHRTAAEIRKRLKLAQVLNEALVELRAMQKVSDYFTGYSLEEALTERINMIGEDSDPETYIGHRRTLLGELEYFKTTTLAAIKEAHKLGELVKTTDVGEDVKVEVQES